MKSSAYFFRLDFLFVNEQNALDRAVFEGNTMIGQAIPAP
jgi:hypothetical protein